jgi:hypothetical protein
MFRIMLRMPQSKIPLPPFTKGELNIEGSGIISKFKERALAGERRTTFEKG